MKRVFVTVASLIILALAGVYTRQVIHETVQSRVPGKQYIVGLGDSVAAGAGLSDTHKHGANSCDVASSAFPFQLGEQLQLPVEQFACSGATVGATATNSTNTVLGTQFTMAESYMTGSDVVVNVGANDIGWLQTLTSCASTDCATLQNRTAITAKLQVMGQNLTRLLGQIQQKHPHRLIVNTYYSLVASGDTCVEHFGITPEEVSFIIDEEQQLNATITAAAIQGKATPVAIDFSGHLLCDATPWIQNITAAAPLHPTTAGQQQIARQDAQAIIGPK